MVQTKLNVSPQLAKIIGTKKGEKITRQQCLKRLMAYVKANELRDPEDNLKVIPDQTMAPIFGTEKIYSIAMMKFLKDHLTKPVQS